MRLRGDVIGSVDKRYFSIHPQTLNLLPDEVREREGGKKEVCTCRFTTIHVNRDNSRY